MSQERSIEEAAAIENVSDSTLRIRIKNDPVHAASVYVVGHKKDGTPLLKTTMRLRWLAQDQDARSYAEYIQRPKKKKL